MDAALGIDIGGSRVRVGVVTREGRIVARREQPLPSEGEPERLARVVEGQARHVIEESRLDPPLAGVALPGVWDRHTGVMQRAVNLPKLEGINICELLEQALHRRVYLDADVNAAIWGQWRSMSPRPHRLVYLSLGTGVGGAVILDGQIVRHTHGGAGHFGFLIVDTTPNAPAGRNEIPGCLSAIASGPALHLAATGETDMAAIGNESLPGAVVGRAARALAVALVQLVHIYAPEVIVLGGGVADHHPELVDRVRESFSAWQSRLMPPDLRIERAPLSTHEAGVIGIALLALAHPPGR